MRLVYEVSDPEILRGFCNAENIWESFRSPARGHPPPRHGTLRAELPGHDQEHWYQAEAEILREEATRTAHPAVVVNVEGVVYTGEYEAASADGYTPGEWKQGDPVPVRIEGDQLYLRRPNGQELQTTVIKRIG
jgi:hypothetical protein